MYVSITFISNMARYTSFIYTVFLWSKSYGKWCSVNATKNQLHSGLIANVYDFSLLVKSETPLKLEVDEKSNELF